MKSTHPRVLQPRVASGLACLLLASATMAACSSGEDSKRKPIDEDSLVQSLPKASAEIDELNWNLTAEPDTIDPANTATYQSGTVVRTLCDSLTASNPDFTPRPSLAVSQDIKPLSIVYTLRDDAKFWDGTPVTAEDVAYSLNRMRNEQYILSFIFINVKSIEVTGANEVTVNFTQPDELFQASLPNVAIMQKAYADNAGDKLGTADGGIMCSGPYKLEKWAAGSSLTVTRNDDYWNTDVPRLAKTIKFEFVNDATAMAQALDSGELDGSYEVPASAIPALEKSDAGRLVFGPSTQSMNLNVATDGGPLADVKLREAFQRMIDRDAIADVVFNGAARPNYTVLVPGQWATDQADKFAAAAEKFKKERSFDIEAATALVKDSSYDGAPLVLAVEAGDETTSRVAQLVQQQAKQAGVVVKINTLQPLAFAEAGYDETKRKGIDLMLQSSFNGTADPLELLGFNLLPGQPYNYTKVDDAEVTRLLTEARQSFNADERADLVLAAQEIYEAQSSTIAIAALHTTTFLREGLTGAVTSFAYWSSPTLAYVGEE